VNDLYLWDQALFTEKLISKDLLDKMFTPYISVPDMPRITGLGYGYGWFIGEINNHRMVFHMGRIEGFTAINSVYPDDKLAVIVLSNQRSENVNGIGIELASLVFGDK
jgi:CubicO group peptidase (beta-lactamase class C family)